MHADRTLPAEKLGKYEARLAEWGDYTGYFERIPAGTDYSAYYDSCECPHLGYIFKGKVRFVYTDGREETVTAGEMYYIPAGHTFQVLEDAETVEFSPTGPYKAHLQKVARNLARPDRGTR